MYACSRSRVRDKVYVFKNRNPPFVSGPLSVSIRLDIL